MIFKKFNSPENFIKEVLKYDITNVECNKLERDSIITGILRINCVIKFKSFIYNISDDIENSISNDKMLDTWFERYNKPDYLINRTMDGYDYIQNLFKNSFIFKLNYSDKSNKGNIINYLLYNFAELLPVDKRDSYNVRNHLESIVIFDPFFTLEDIKDKRKISIGYNDWKIDTEVIEELE